MNFTISLRFVTALGLVPLVSAYVGCSGGGAATTGGGTVTNTSSGQTNGATTSGATGATATAGASGTNGSTATAGTSATAGTTAGTSATASTGATGATAGTNATSGTTTSTGATGTGGTSTGATGTATPTSACRNAVLFQCDRRVECGSPIDGCAAFADLCPEYYFSPGSGRTLDNVQACLETLRHQSCDEVTLGMLPACLAGGTVPGNASCAFPSQCQSTTCQAATSCGTCVALAKLGESCGTGSVDCGPGTFCHPGAHTCMSSTSIVRAGLGEACDLTANPIKGCQADLKCNTTSLTCQAIPCATASCDSSSFCNPSATTVACTPRATAGQTCGTTLGTGALCVPSSFCALPNDGGARVCVDVPTRGTACSATEPCRTYWQCVGGKCEPLACGGDAGP